MSWNPADRIERYAAELRATLADDLESVTLFGSVPRGEAVEGLSDIDLLVLVRDASPTILARAAPATQAWQEESGAVPLLFTPDEWRRSADVFPVELADMQDHHRVLFGSDPVGGVHITPVTLRLQVERELRGKMAQLRRGIFIAADHPADLGRLLLGAAPSVATWLRALLRLHREPVPAATPDVARAATRLVGTPPDAFLELWAAREHPRTYQPTAAETEAIYTLLLRTADHVDIMEAR